MARLQEENAKLQLEVEELRKQSTKSIVKSPPSPPHISPTSSTTSKDDNNINLSLSKNTNNNNGKISRPIVNQIKGSLPSVPQSHQPTSPASRYLVIPNVNKDASSANKKTWQDSRVRVQTTFIPEFNLDKHLFEEKSASYLDSRNTYPDRYPSIINLIEFSQCMDGQRFWLAYMLISTAMQQMTNLFIEAVCATPKDQEASVLDWLYDAMVKHVVEQSQMEAKITELSSDWVSEELDDNVLPYLF